jgi:hypothetical protein
MRTYQINRRNGKNYRALKLPKINKIELHLILLKINCLAILGRRSIHFKIPNPVEHPTGNGILQYFYFKKLLFLCVAFEGKGGLKLAIF